MDIISFIELIERHGLIVVLFVVGYVYLHFKFKSVDGDIKEIKEAFAKHEEKCEERQKQFIDYMKDHEGRISHVEGRLNERQPQPAT